MHDRHGNLQTRTEHSVREDYDALREDMASLRQDLSQLTQSLISAGYDGVQKIDANVRKSAQAVRERASEQVDNVRERIEEKPLMAVGGAFAIGVIAGAVAHRLRCGRSAA